MKNDSNKNSYPNHMNLEKYSDFEFIWLETMLNRIIKKSDIIYVFKKFEIEFTEKKYIEVARQEEIGNIIINDIKKEKLLPLIKDIIKEKYPYLLSFNKCKEIYNDLSKKDKSVLTKIYINISQNKNLKELMKDQRFIKENREKDLIDFIIDELYKVPEDEVIKKLKNKEVANGNKTGREKNNS